VLGVVLVGTGHYPAEEIATALGVEVLAWLPADPRGATGASVGALRRTPLLRAARSMAEAVAGRLADSAAAPAPGSASAAPAGFPTAPPPRSEPAREAQP
jgi:hypothetical protein